MRPHLTARSWKPWVIGLVVMYFTAGAFSGMVFGQRDSDSSPSSKVIARGAGTTIIQGGTGAPSFTPVLTTIAFHAERQGGAVTGGFECLERSGLLVVEIRFDDGSHGSSQAVVIWEARCRLRHPLPCSKASR